MRYFATSQQKKEEEELTYLISSVLRAFWYSKEPSDSFLGEVNVCFRFFYALVDSVTPLLLSTLKKSLESQKPVFSTG